MKKEMKLSNIILPSKRINFFVVTIILLGVISGSVFLITLSKVDKSNTILQIQTFFNNINKDSINNGQAIKNSLVINYVFVGVIWILGLSIIGVLFNIFLAYIKGFIVGFSVSSIILTYGYKGVIAAFLYVFPSQVLNIIVVGVLTIYSIMFSKNLLAIITTKHVNRLILKRYMVILIISIIISFISILCEVYLFPRALKLVISLYIK